MVSHTLCFELLSAATFGRGDGVAGLVDREIEHDGDGLPYVRGRTVKGLLAEECANILFSLEKQGRADEWRLVAKSLFGSSGSTLDSRGLMRLGDARPPESLRQAVRVALADSEQSLTPTDVLESLTAIRRQTAMNEHGGPDRGSLRAMRVLLPGTVLEARLEFHRPPGPREMELLAACILAWRRGGTARNRGRGRLRAWLCDESGQDLTEAYYRAFLQEVSA